LRTPLTTAPIATFAATALTILIVALHLGLGFRYLAHDELSLIQILEAMYEVLFVLSLLVVGCIVWIVHFAQCLMFNELD
jgi:hypothetical protein